MARLELSLPEEFGPRSEVGRTATERTSRNVEVGRRTDGSGEPLPVIVRWFRTWAMGEAVAGQGSP